MVSPQKKIHQEKTPQSNDRRKAVHLKRRWRRLAHGRSHGTLGGPELRRNSRALDSESRLGVMGGPRVDGNSPMLGDGMTPPFNRNSYDGYIKVLLLGWWPSPIWIYMFFSWNNHQAFCKKLGWSVMITLGVPVRKRIFDVWNPCIYLIILFMVQK